MSRRAAVFRTAARDAFVTVQPSAALPGGFTATCDGCGWTLTNAVHNLDQPDMARENALESMKRRANQHALGCAEMPQDAWPGNQMTGGW